MMEMMSTMFNDLNGQIGQLVTKVVANDDVRNQRRNLFNTLDHLQYLSVEDKLSVSKTICTNVEYHDIFSGLNEANKEAMVNMIIAKRF